MTICFINRLTIPFIIIPKIKSTTYGYHFGTGATFSENPVLKNIDSK